MKIVNIYCDESNHLENDDSNVMTIGAVYVESKFVKEINDDIREIKSSNGVPVSEELKWTRISNKRLPVYIDLINYFFESDKLFSRTILIPNKQGLNHSVFNQTHDEWYYKMHYRLIENIIEPDNAYNVFLDYKDTNMHYKSLELLEILKNKFRNFNRASITKVQPIRSHEVEIMQIVDVIIGAIAYKNKGLESSTAKLKIIDLIEEKSDSNLVYGSILREKKLNRFIWDIAGDTRDL